MSKKTPQLGYVERLLVNLVVSRLGLKDLLRGRKTYIVGFLMVAQGLYALLTGEGATYANPTPVGTQEAWDTILMGLGFATGRAGVAKVQEAVERNGNGS